MSRGAYSSTKIAPERTQAEIITLLKKHHAKDYQWTTFHGQTTLKFILKVRAKGVEKEMAYMFQPPVIPKKVRQWNQRLFRNELIIVNDEPAAYRLLLWYLKNKLLAVEKGMVSAEKEFMANILVSLPTGEETTLGDRVTQALENAPNLNGFAALPLIETSSKTERDEKIVDTTGEVR